jgi:hypothetical protein
MTSTCDGEGSCDYACCPGSLSAGEASWDGCALAGDGKQALALAAAAALEAQIVTPFTSMVISTVTAAPDRRNLANCTTPANTTQDGTSAGSTACNTSLATQVTR